MHVPDGFLDAPTSLATGAVAVAGVGLALRRARGELDERTTPLAGLTAAFVFAGQMLNFPVGLGTSGHLMGGALAAALVGPWTAVLCLSVVLMVQALLFADGGLTALGTNITLIGLVTVLAGWAVTRLVLALAPRRPASVVAAAALGALVSVPAAALVFTGLFLAGGAASVPAGGLAVSMLGWHALIGAGEAVITALTVSAVISVRPDLVYAARLSASARPRRTRGLMLGGVAVSLALAGAVSFFASSSPDGLEHVAAEQGFLDTAREHVLAGSPLADYGDVAGLPVGLVGVLGVAVVLAVAAAVFHATRALRRRADDLTT